MSINALYFGSHWATGRLPFAIAHGPWPSLAKNLPLIPLYFSLMSHDQACCAQVSHQL